MQSAPIAAVNWCCIILLLSRVQATLAYGVIGNPSSGGVLGPCHCMREASSERSLLASQAYLRPGMALPAEMARRPAGQYSGGQDSATCKGLKAGAAQPGRAPLKGTAGALSAVPTISAAEMQCCISLLILERDRRVSCYCALPAACFVTLVFSSNQSAVRQSNARQACA